MNGTATRPIKDQRSWNPNRDGWYGVRVGDLVAYVRPGGFSIEGDVVELDPMDNNRVYIETTGNRWVQRVRAVPEHCQIVAKVEDRP